MNDTIRAFWRDESGPEMVEWAVVTAILLSATVVLVLAVKDTLLELFRSSFDKLEEAPPSAFP